MHTGNKLTLGGGDCSQEMLALPAMRARLLQANPRAGRRALHRPDGCVPNMRMSRDRRDLHAPHRYLPASAVVEEPPGPEAGRPHRPVQSPRAGGWSLRLAPRENIRKGVHFPQTSVPTSMEDPSGAASLSLLRAGSLGISLG